MNITYCFPQLPTTYWINVYHMKCIKCARQFEILRPNGHSVTKFLEVNGTEIKWLPTNGKGGYLDLLEKLVPEYNVSRQITMKIARNFDVLLQKYVEFSKQGNPFTSITGNIDYCPSCGSETLEELSEDILSSPNIEWLRISCDLL